MPTPQEVSEAVTVGEAAWPGVTLDASGQRTLAERLRCLDGALDHAADLYLAFSCASGLPAALAALERVYLTQVPRYIAHLGVTTEQAEEVRQRLAERLLVGEAPRIAEYSGKGPLGGWLRVSAIRIALDLLRAQRDEVRDPDLALAQLADDDPNLALLKARYRPTIDRALRELGRTLPPRQANLLRLHYAQGVSLEQLARTYGVHRATITRWIAQARAEVVDGLFERLRAELKLSRDEFDSLVPAVLSQLSLSLTERPET